MTLTILCVVLLVGGALGLRFKVLILLPAIGVAAVGVGAVGIAHGHGIGNVMWTIIWVGTALQAGYLVGLAMRALIVPIATQGGKLVVLGKFGLR